MYNMLLWRKNKPAKERLMFNKWYDQQKEPYRFLIMLVIASPIVTAGVWVDSPVKGFLVGAYAGLLMVPRVLHLRRGNNG